MKEPRENLQGLPHSKKGLVHNKPINLFRSNTTISALGTLPAMACSCLQREVLVQEVGREYREKRKTLYGKHSMINIMHPSLSTKKQTKKTQKSTPRYIKVKFVKDRDKEKILKTARKMIEQVEENPQQDPKCNSHLKQRRPKGLGIQTVERKQNHKTKQNKKTCQSRILF